MGPVSVRPLTFHKNVFYLKSIGPIRIVFYEASGQSGLVRLCSPSGSALPEEPEGTIYLQNRLFLQNLLIRNYRTDCTEIIYADSPHERKREVEGVRYEARSRGRSSPDNLTFRVREKQNSRPRDRL